MRLPHWCWPPVPFWICAHFTMIVQVEIFNRFEIVMEALNYLKLPIEHMECNQQKMPSLFFRSHCFSTFFLRVFSMVLAHFVTKLWMFSHVSGNKNHEIHSSAASRENVPHRKIGQEFNWVKCVLTFFSFLHTSIAYDSWRLFFLSLSLPNTCVL